MTTGDGAKGKIKNTVCPLCGKQWDDKHKNNEKENCPNGNSCGRGAPCSWGNIGLGGMLGTRIANASKSGKDKYIETHPMAYKGGKLQAHHLICSEAMSDKQGKWAEICFLTGYNINCYKNGVFLPSELEQACGARVPVHISKHSGGFGGGTAIRYPAAVKSEIAPILNKARRLKACQDETKLKDIVDELNVASKNIFGKIKSFMWTITSDGFDYQEGNPIGCGNQNSIPAKKNKKTREIKRKRISVESEEKRRENLIEFFKDCGVDETLDNSKCKYKRKHSTKPYKLKLGK